MMGIPRFLKDSVSIARIFQENKGRATDNKKPARFTLPEKVKRNDP